MERRPRTATVNHKSERRIPTPSERSASKNRKGSSSGRKKTSSSRDRGRSSSVYRGSSSSDTLTSADIEARKRARAKKRREAELRKKRRLMVGGAAALVVIIAVLVIIIVSAVTVPEPSNLEVESSATTQILTWKGKPKNISYQVYRKTEDTEYELVSTIPEGGTCSFVSSDLTSATPYEYKVVAVKGSGEKVRESKGKTVSAYTLPITPEIVSALTMSKDSLTISWTPDQPVDGYELRLGKSQDLENAEVLNFSPSDTEMNAATGALSYLIPGLAEGETFYFSLRCFCGEEIYSEWSDVYSATVTRAIDMTGIDVNKPMVALTFDDGPDKGPITDRIIAALDSVGGHATFFQLGQLCEQYPEVAKKIVDSGNQIGCHTYDHEHMGEAVTVEDITRANDAIEETTGVRPDAFRAPGGSPTDLILSTCESEGQALYHWSVDTRDWSSRDAESVINEVQQNVSDGDIILMHNIYESTAEAAEQVIPWLKEQGYQLVTVDQLIQAKTGQPPVPGTQYFSATNYR